MKVGIVITHPTQFDVPVYKIGNNIIDVLYTDSSKIRRVYDAELEKEIVWQTDNLEGYNFQVLPNRRPGRFLRRFIRDGNYDLLITSGYSNLFYIVSIIWGSFCAKKNAIRIDTVGWNNKSFVKRIYKRILFKILNLFIDYYFVVGSASKNFLLDNCIKSSKILFYGYIIDSSLFQKKNTDIQSLKQQLDIPPNKKVLVCVSKHNNREAPFDTINAIASLPQSEYHLIVVGDGPLNDQLKQKVRQLELSNISFVGYVPYNQLPQFYSASDIFIHDSHDEPWGVSIQEAIASNILVLASDRVGAAYDLIADDINGYKFKHGDVSDLVAKIIKSQFVDLKEMANYNSSLLKNWDYPVILSNIKKAASSAV